MTSDLKSCPFCGSKAFISGISNIGTLNAVARVSCMKFPGCAATISVCIGKEETRDEAIAKAIKAWNTRHPSASSPETLVERLEAEMLDEVVDGFKMESHRNFNAGLRCSITHIHQWQAEQPHGREPEGGNELPYNNKAVALGIKSIKAIIYHWLEYNSDKADEQHVIRPPVWPTIGVLKAWAVTLDRAGILLDHAAIAAMEPQGVPPESKDVVERGRQAAIAGGFLLTMDEEDQNECVSCILRGVRSSPEAPNADAIKEILRDALCLKHPAQSDDERVDIAVERLQPLLRGEVDIEAGAKAIQKRYWKGDLPISISDARKVCTAFAEAAAEEWELKYDK